MVLTGYFNKAKGRWLHWTATRKRRTVSAGKPLEDNEIEPRLGCGEVPHTPGKFFKIAFSQSGVFALCVPLAAFSSH
jgi:hypothetical protein